MCAEYLYIDTESDPATKRVETVQYRFRGTHGIISEFTRDSWSFLAALWQQADGVVMFNAPYDLGVLSSAFPGLNSFAWVNGDYGNYWNLRIFGDHYKVRRIAGHRNLITAFAREHTPEFEKLSHRSRAKSTPVIDVLKLWSILVDDGRNGSISLKALIKRELGREAIPYSPEAAATDAYRYQDVDCLEEVWHRFLDRVAGIADVAGYGPEEWAFVKTPATCTKLAYENAYPHLRAMQGRNDESDAEHGLSGALETAYHGGITIALHRGLLPNTAWFDLKGAYASVISFLNTDTWLEYTWEHGGYEQIESREIPVLCRVETDAHIASVNKSLKIFRTRQKQRSWYWNFDVQTLKILFPDARITLLDCYRPLPGNPCEQSLPAEWNRLKDEEKARNGKTTLYDYYKFLSNTSYGIKAQRSPFRTVHTNLVIAGIITSRVHLSLVEMMDECRSCGMRWLYSDTDSVCLQYGTIPDDIEDRINARIAPMRAECEGIGFHTRILSLKRYVSAGGRYLDGRPAGDKIKLHGKGRYRISPKFILDCVTNQRCDDHKPLVIGQLAANTAVTLKQLINAYPPCESHVHPFAFHTNIPTERSLSEWFWSWYAHSDTKLSLPDGDVPVTAEYSREFMTFETYAEALRFWNAQLPDEPVEPETIAGGYTAWDEEMRFAFPSSVENT